MEVKSLLEKLAAVDSLGTGEAATKGILVLEAIKQRIRDGEFN